MRRLFITGLVLLLPVVITFFVMAFIVDFLTSPFQEMVQSLLEHYELFPKGFLFLTSHQVIYTLSSFLILVAIFVFLIGIGVLTRWYLIHSVIRLGDYLLHRIPIVNKVYKACQDVIHTFFTHEESGFKKVVIVPFPTPNSQAFGLLTQESLPKGSEIGRDQKMSVYIPGTPNPMAGFLMMFDVKDVVITDMKVDDALKYIISCGVMSAEFKTKP